MNTLTLDRAPDTEQTAPNSTPATIPVDADDTARLLLSDTSHDTAPADTARAETPADADTAQRRPLSDTSHDTAPADTARAETPADADTAQRRPLSDTNYDTAPADTARAETPADADTAQRRPLSDTNYDTAPADTARAETPADTDTAQHCPLSDTNYNTTAADNGNADTRTDAHADTPNDAPAHEGHRTALAALKRKSDQIRYAAAAVAQETGTLTDEDPAPAEVLAWLARFGIEPNHSYARGVVAEWRHENRPVDLSPIAPAETDDEDTAPELPPLPPADEMDEETAALAAKVATARGRLPLQNDPALRDALSDEEMDKERALAEWERETDREIRRRTKQAELDAIKRDQETAVDIAKMDSRDRRWHSKAVAASRRMASPEANLAMLYRNSEWSSRALIAMVIVGMIWSGVNVQHNLVPSGNMREILYWLSYGLEAMISVPIIVIMVVSTSASRVGKSLDRGKVILAEVALLSLTIGLNSGPHLMNDPGTAAKYAIAPVMVGAMVWMHAWSANRYADLIKDATKDMQHPATETAAGKTTE